MGQLSGHAGDPVRSRLELDDFRAVKQIRIRSVQNMYQGLIDEHAGSIIEGKPMDGAAAVHNLALVHACHASARNRGEIIRVAS
jgi:hypothetical protein